MNSLTKKGLCMSETTPKNTGKLKVDPYRLRKLLIARGLTLEELQEASLVSKQTAQRLIRGGETRMSTLRDVAAALGVRPMDLVHPSEYEPEEIAAAAPSSGDWEITAPVGLMQAASNGLMFRIFRMQHRHQPVRFGRGKRYELFELPTDEKELLRTQLVRHMEVCDATGRSPQLPVCYAAFPEPSQWVWWIVDEWVDAAPLIDQLDGDPLPLPRVARWALELAEGIGSLHAAKVIRRELNPSNVHVRDADGTLLLTDFELAKLCGDGPTVSGEWPDDPYRAPEIGAGEPTTAADLYSWGRVVAHLVAGVLPERGKELAAVQKRLSSRVAHVVAHCTQLPPSERCQSVDEIMPTVRAWAKETGGAD